MKKKLWLVALLGIWALTLAGCNKNTPVENPVENLEENVEMANPASVFCEENNGTLNLEEWLCMFEDGSYCEEWSYQRWECQPGEIIYNTNSEEEIISDEVIEEENEATEVSDEEVVNDVENTDETIEEADAEM